MVLGKTDEMEEGEDAGLSEEDLVKDKSLDFLFGEEGQQSSKKSRQVKKWLEDVRKVFDHEAIAFLQKEAIDQFNLKELLLENEFLQNAEPNVDLLKEILSLKELMDSEQKDIARGLISRIVKEIEKKLTFPTIQQVRRGLKRQIHRRQSSPRDIDWHKTIQANLKNYQKEARTVIPEVWKGYERTTPSLKNVFLVIDQSASMAESVIYAGIFGCILAKIRSMGTQAILFDNEVVDITHHLDDAVELMLGLQLGGGTDIGQAMQYALQKIESPTKTVLFLISDLEDTGDRDITKAAFAELVHSGVRCHNIVAMSDEGRPRYDKELAEELSRIGVPFGYCTTEEFPLLLQQMLQ